MFGVLGKIFAGGAVLALILGITVLAIESLPGTQAGNTAYPAPIATNDIPPTIAPEVLCDQWFSFRKGLPEDQRKIIEVDYWNCVSARKTPAPVGVKKTLPDNPPSGVIPSLHFRRPAGIGTILETGLAPLSSDYRIVNQWFADLNGAHIKVYAGGRRNGSAGSTDINNRLAWPGILVVIFTDRNGKVILDKSGEFETPQNQGPVRIVEADGMNLTLVAGNGISFKFDVVERRFSSTQSSSLVSRSLGAGIIIESGTIQYQIDGYEFVNQMTYNPDGNAALIMFAGNEQNNPRKGVFIVGVLSGDRSEILHASVYKTDLGDGALRIVNVERVKLTLVSESGLVYEFDLAESQFTSLPSGSKPISAITLPGAILNTEAGALLATRTPTITPTPQPTRTALPTYNPYP